MRRWATALRHNRNVVFRIHSGGIGRGEVIPHNYNGIGQPWDSRFWKSLQASDNSVANIAKVRRAFRHEGPGLLEHFDECGRGSHGCLNRRGAGVDSLLYHAQVAAVSGQAGGHIQDFFGVPRGRGCSGFETFGDGFGCRLEVCDSSLSLILWQFRSGRRW